LVDKKRKRREKREERREKREERREIFHLDGILNIESTSIKSSTQII